MLELNTLAVDPSAAQNGVWADFMGARFLIARHNNEAANFHRSRLVLDNFDAIQAQDDSAEQLSRKIQVEVMANHVLLGWEGVTIDGSQVDYTPELGIKYLGDPRFSDLFQFVENFSLHRANFRERAEAEAAESVKDSAAS